MARNLTPEQKASKRAYEVAWRKKNAGKVREQQERKRLRAKGLMAPHVPASLVTEEEKRRHRAERMNRAYAKQREKIATDPEYAAKYRAESNERGKSNYQRIKADPEAYQVFLAAKRERNRLKRRRARGLPDDHVFEKKPPPPRQAKPKDPAKVLVKSQAKSQAKQKETQKQKLKAERARRAAEVEAAKAQAATINQSSTVQPQACPDPPELQALFKKASKGEPARPLPPWHKKKTAFQIRGWV